ncbi:hypothetical protein BpHYR1_053759 [Brachionus plicatilis]|uniref:Uncharacterized protein n=1 Tax=Brachionus plicatilis TaxID=10195 RepID=A0A3M7PGV0_BRAPC|nr:hypothetical protein BpHYR1_053759 [Brachionus plicatilis]
MFVTRYENRQTRSTPSIAQILDTLDKDPEEPHFNYISSLMNHETLDAMSNANLKGKHPSKLNYNLEGRFRFKYINCIECRETINNFGLEKKTKKIKQFQK